MSCTFALSRAAIRRFRSCLVHMGKISSELAIEVLPTQLVLRAINGSKSAYLAVRFEEDHFDYWELAGTAVIQTGVLMKAILTPLRSVGSASSVRFRIDSTSSYLEVDVTCESGLLKTYHISYADVQVLEATVDGSTLVTAVTAHSPKLNNLLASFQASVNEITVAAYPKNHPHAADGREVTIQSYSDPAQQGAFTHVDIDPALFAAFEHRSPRASDVTFSVHELRAMVALCELLRARVCIKFSRHGAPVVVEPDPEPANETGHVRMDVTAQLVLASLPDSTLPPEEQRHSPPPAERAPSAAPARSPSARPARGPPSAPTASQRQQLSQAHSPPVAAAGGVRSPAPTPPSASKRSRIQRMLDSDSSGGEPTPPAPDAFRGSGTGAGPVGSVQGAYTPPGDNGSRQPPPHAARRPPPLWDDGESAPGGLDGPGGSQDEEVLASTPTEQRPPSGFPGTRPTQFS